MSPVAIVTGAAGGIGSAISLRLRSAGWLVAGFDLTSAPEVDLVAELDVSDPEEMAREVSVVERKLGAVDAYVSGAGHYESVPFLDVTDEQASRMLRAHLGGFLAGSRAVLPTMLERGSGSIVAVSSELALEGGRQDSHYAAAEGALLGAMRSLAAEVAGRGVRVNAVALGLTNTPILTEDSPWRDTEHLATLPTRAPAETEEIARCVEFALVSATFMSGETLRPNSGAVI